MDENEIKKELERIHFEIRWIQRNMNPPVNYLLIVLVSIIASVMATFVVLQL